MASADRPSFVPLQFKKGLETYREAFSGDFAPKDLMSRLIHEIAAAQRRNGKWIDEKLVSPRVERGEPLLDVLLVSEDGTIIRSHSTYRAFANDAQLMLDVPSLVTYAKRREQFVYPLTGERDAMLFWYKDHEAEVLHSLGNRFGSVSVRNYIVHGTETGVRIADIPRDVMGEGNFAKDGIIYGTLGFFVNHRLGLGKNGPRNHIERARFGKSKLNPDKTFFVSPVSVDEIRQNGGSLMDEIRPNVSVLRVDVKATNDDFIAAAILGMTDFHHPVVLRYASLRPWLGEVPKRGGQ